MELRGDAHQFTRVPRWKSSASGKLSTPDCLDAGGAELFGFAGETFIGSGSLTRSFSQTRAC